MAQLAPHEEIANLRRPKILITEDFLNDPIHIETDDRFHPETVLRQLDEFPVITRDGANFVIVDLGVSGAAYYPVQMFTQNYKRAELTKYINREFKEL
jgi:hypothetical protein